MSGIRNERFSRTIEPEEPVSPRQGPIRARVARIDART